MIAGNPSGLCPVWNEGRTVEMENADWELISNKGATWTPEVISQWGCPVAHALVQSSSAFTPPWWECMLAGLIGSQATTDRGSCPGPGLCSAVGVWITAGTSASKAQVKLGSLSHFFFYLAFPLVGCLLVLAYLHVGAIMVSTDNCCHCCGETPTSSWPVVAVSTEGSWEPRARLGRSLWYSSVVSSTTYVCSRSQRKKLKYASVH